MGHFIFSFSFFFLANHMAILAIHILNEKLLEFHLDKFFVLFCRDFFVFFLKKKKLNYRNNRSIKQRFACAMHMYFSKLVCK